MTMDQDQEQALGHLICNQTPYKAMKLAENWQKEIQWDERTGPWNFRGVDRRVAKALRIPVIITYHNAGTGEDEQYVDWLIIGYEGSAAY